MSEALVIERIDALATVQDFGRMGHQRLGVSVAGAMDRRSFSLANILAGNPAEEAAIEFARAGGRLRCHAPTARLAIAGPYAIAVDEQNLGGWRSVTISHGQSVTITPGENGVYGYLAVSGGIALPAAFGSRATHLRTGMGGVEGRGLRAGDQLRLAATRPFQGGDRALNAADLPPPRKTIRVVLGPQQEFFTAEAVAAFLSDAYRITRDADRMGIRLEGPPIAMRDSATIESEGTAFGSIQVPGNGQPIVLMADRQSVGGYPKIATVIEADLPALAQLRPGDALRFEAVTHAAAVVAREAANAWLSEIPRRFSSVSTAPDLSHQRLMGINLIDGVVGPWSPFEEEAHDP